MKKNVYTKKNKNKEFILKFVSYVTVASVWRVSIGRKQRMLFCVSPQGGTGGPRSSVQSFAPTQVWWHKKGTAQGQLISLFIIKNHWTDNNCSQLVSLSKQTVHVCVRACVRACVCVCVCASSGSVCVYVLPLPGGLALTCLWHGFFFKKPRMYCCCALFCPLLIILHKIMLKKNSKPYHLKIPYHQYYTNSIFNSHIIIWLKTKSFNVQMFLDIEK